MPEIFKKAYLEITNVCNLTCEFCKGTDREKGFISVENFEVAASKLRKITSFLYLHVLGEPTLHPELSKLLEICENLGFRVIITTNGTLVEKVENLLVNSPCVHKVNISLHALEVNKTIVFDEYLEKCALFCKKMNDAGKICVLRLWNGDKDNKYNSGKLNEPIIKHLEKHFPRENWTKNRQGFSLYGKIFIEFAERFDWRENDEDTSVRCYGLRDQIGVLCDGTVVPCCIDCDGNIKLGNIFTDDIYDIINSDLAKSMAEGFRNGKAVHPYCKKCGFVRTRL